MHLLQHPVFDIFYFKIETQVTSKDIYNSNDKYINNFIEKAENKSELTSSQNAMLEQQTNFVECK